MAAPSGALGGGLRGRWRSAASCEGGGERAVASSCSIVASAAASEQRQPGSSGCIPWTAGRDGEDGFVRNDVALSCVDLAKGIAKVIRMHTLAVTTWLGSRRQPYEDIVGRHTDGTVPNSMIGNLPKELNPPPSVNMQSFRGSYVRLAINS
uniref:Uncharacterized protein n=1 Tax=Leersia perrieri TaxID=77586 RepID=A0A0D9VPL6_9ORYZ